MLDKKDYESKLEYVFVLILYHALNMEHFKIHYNTKKKHLYVLITVLKKFVGLLELFSP